MTLEQLIQMITNAGGEEDLQELLASLPETAAPHFEEVAGLRAGAEESSATIESLTKQIETANARLDKVLEQNSALLKNAGNAGEISTDDDEGEQEVISPTEGIKTIDELYKEED